MTARWLAFVVWAAVAASAVFWGLRLFVSAPGAPAHTLALDMGAAPHADLARLFGAEQSDLNDAPAEPGLASRFQLVGVAAPKPAEGRGGVALIAVDGKPARAFRVGSRVDTDLVLQSVQTRGASIGPRGGPVRVQLDLPPLPLPNVGSLPRAQVLSDGEGGPGPADTDGPPGEMPMDGPVGGPGQVPDR